MVSWRTEIIHHGRAIVAKIVRELIDAAAPGFWLASGSVCFFEKSSTAQLCLIGSGGRLSRRLVHFRIEQRRHFSARRGRLLRAALARYGLSDSDHGANAPLSLYPPTRSGGNVLLKTGE